MRCRRTLRISTSRNAFSVTLMLEWLPQFLLNFMPIAFVAGCVYECAHELREKKRAKKIERKEKRREVVANMFDHGLLTSNEVRSICNDHVQVAYTGSVNVVGDNNTVSTTFYADNVQYLQISQASDGSTINAVQTIEIPPPYGTEERR